MDVSVVRTLRKFLRVIEREVESELKAQTTCCGVTSAQCHALLELAEGGELSLVELAGRLKLDTSTMSRTVDGLVKAGHVHRSIDPGNRRYVLLGLTGKGRRKVEFIDRACDSFYMRLLERVPDGKRKPLVESVELLAVLFASLKEEERRAGVAAPCRAEREERHG